MLPSIHRASGHDSPLLNVFQDKCPYRYGDASYLAVRFACSLPRTRFQRRFFCRYLAICDGFAYLRVYVPFSFSCAQIKKKVHAEMQRFTNKID